MKIFAYAAAALLTAGLVGTPAMADGHGKKIPTAKVVDKKLSKDALKAVPSFLMQKKGGEKEAQSAARSGNKRRLVVVDGILMEMNENVVNAWLKLGVFKLVYPGTTEPVGFPSEVPGYPPIWVNYPPK